MDSEQKEIESSSNVNAARKQMYVDKDEMDKKIFELIHSFENRYGLLFDGVNTERTQEMDNLQSIVTAQVVSQFVTK